MSDFARQVAKHVVVSNAFVVTLFWLVYWVWIMQRPQDFETVSNPAVDALHLSAMTQTTIGSSAVYPKTWLAVMAVTLQSIVVMGLLLSVITVISS